MRICYTECFCGLTAGHNGSYSNQDHENEIWKDTQKEHAADDRALSFLPKNVFFICVMLLLFRYSIRIVYPCDNYFSEIITFGNFPFKKILELMYDVVCFYIIFNAVYSISHISYKHNWKLFQITLTLTTYTYVLYSTILYPTAF